MRSVIGRRYARRMLHIDTGQTSDPVIEATNSSVFMLALLALGWELESYAKFPHNARRSAIAFCIFAVTTDEYFGDRCNCAAVLIVAE